VSGIQHLSLFPFSGVLLFFRMVADARFAQYHRYELLFWVGVAGLARQKSVKAKAIQI
jgi:hypothetical protein